MSCIHFKFSNTVENEKLKFDGLQISLSDLRDAIIKLKNLKANLYSLKIIDAQTKKEYIDDSQMLPRNSSVVVSRVPVSSSLKAPKSKFKETPITRSETVVPGLTSTRMASSGPKGLAGDDATVLTPEQLMQTADLANANASETAKVKAMMMQSTESYENSQYVWTPRGNSGSSTGLHTGLKKNPPPPTYTCFRCGNRGHWIQMCPTNGDPTFNNYRYKRSNGIPSSQLVAVSEAVEGAMLNHKGQLVARAEDLAAMESAKLKRQKRLQATEEPKKNNKPPEELICSLCKEIMKEAVIIPCCGESFCSECICTHLCDNEFTCPACKKDKVSPETLAPNKALRQSAKNFRARAAEAKSIAVAASTGFIKKDPIIVPPKPPVVRVSPPTTVSKSTPAVKNEVFNPITKPITVSPNKTPMFSSSAVKAIVKTENGSPTIKATEKTESEAPAITTKAEKGVQGLQAEVVKSILPKLEETEVNSRPKSSSRGPTPVPMSTEDLRKSPLSSIENTQDDKEQVEKSDVDLLPVENVASLSEVKAVSPKPTDAEGNLPEKSDTNRLPTKSPPPAEVIVKSPNPAGVKVDSELDEKNDTNELSLTPGLAGVNESLLKSAAAVLEDKGPVVMKPGVDMNMVPLPLRHSGLSLMASKPAVPLTSGIPPIPGGSSILGQPVQPPHFSTIHPVLLPGATTYSGLPGSTGLVGGHLGGMGPPASLHQSKGEHSKQDDLADVLLLTSAVTQQKPPSPPLSIEEFYRHQKLLKLLTKDRIRRRSSSHSSRSYSRSSDSSSSYFSSSSSSDYSRSISRSPLRTRKRDRSRHEKHHRVKDDKKRSKTHKESKERRLKELLREQRDRRGGSKELARKYKEKLKQEKLKQHRHSRHKRREESSKYRSTKKVRKDGSTKKIRLGDEEEEMKVESLAADKDSTLNERIALEDKNVVEESRAMELLKEAEELMNAEGNEALESDKTVEGGGACELDKAVEITEDCRDTVDLGILEEDKATEEIEAVKESETVEEGEVEEDESVDQNNVMGQDKVDEQDEPMDEENVVEEGEVVEDSDAGDKNHHRHHHRRHRREYTSEGREKKRRKDKKHKHSSKEHKRSQKSKKNSHVEKAEKRKYKKHKKSSGHSEKSRHHH